MVSSTDVGSYAGVVSRKIKKVASSTPVISAPGDLVKGFSGLDEVLSKIKMEPRNPMNYIFLYEVYRYYEKANSGANKVRWVLNSHSAAIRWIINSVLNLADDQYEEIDPMRFLQAALVLGMKIIKNKAATGVNLFAIGRTLYYIAVNERDQFKRKDWLLRSIKYISSAISMEGARSDKAEFFFYLSESYQLAENYNMAYRALNMSRKLGFSPALDRIRKALKYFGATFEEQMQVSIPYGVKELTDYRFQYKPKLMKRMENAAFGLADNQFTKAENLVGKIKHFFD